MGTPQQEILQNRPEYTAARSLLRRGNDDNFDMNVAAYKAGLIEELPVQNKVAQDIIQGHLASLLVSELDGDVEFGSMVDLYSQLTQELTLYDIASIQSIDPDELSPQDVERFKTYVGHSLISTVEMMIDPANPVLGKPGRWLDRATEVAQKYGVSIETVFEDDSLFVEYTREFGNSPTDFIHALLSTTERITPEKLLHSTVASAVYADYAVGIIAEDQVQDEINECVTEALNDPEVVDDLTKLHLKVQAVLRFSAVYFLNKIWGPEAYHSLPTELKDQLQETPSSQ